ncbi:uncharacterized protein EI90DRAFT_3030938 [Cantharellus anzutake]|uniref:uncharacterized protein n=1 Tax=Cantharellus anzutake TaxID=1750568 RepID=UPI00190320F9|nr:uncharacterized protein EI90DRAFT_3030938 [Cantharellus anzutake]KAF8342982.1 hypothetical protein EI90DRAFT_3030938 [Cantharellus anzutake]
MVAVSLLLSIAPAFVLSAHAFPALRRWPDGPTHINGEDAKAAYNSTHGGSPHIRQQSLCQSITMDQLNAMGDALQDAKTYATNTWGAGWDTITVNPPEYPGNPAQACYPSPMTFTATWNSDPTCSTSSVRFTGFAAKGTNAAQVSIYQGSSVSASTTVESSTTIGSATEFTAGVTVGIPETAQFSYSISETVSVSLTNTKGSTTQNTNDARSTAQDTVTCDGPANVDVDVDLQTCTAQGNVNFPVTLGGWVWFYYGSQKNGHYKWAVNLDADGVSPIAHRQQTLSLSVNANTQTYGHFYSKSLFSWDDLTFTCLRTRRQLLPRLNSGWIMLADDISNNGFIPFPF